MGFLDKIKKVVADAKQEIEDATTEEIDYQRGPSGYMRENKSEPLKQPKKES